MAALRQEHRYGLSCGKINKSIPNKTIFHVKLTDTAIRTLEAYKNLKGSLPNQPAICFKGNQGEGSPIPGNSHKPCPGLSPDL
uniref:RNA polymerase II elongation factor ELL2-like n=1 Tax=Cyprinus carpio TaxID=7962 RepID=A0A8C2AIU8_CYPCA